ncbi:MAG: hypothetical protein R6X34_07730 [Chloroflexota bacterium]|jgi:hypothetical protein
MLLRGYHDLGVGNGRFAFFAIAQRGIFTLPQLMIDGQLVQFRYHGRRSIEEQLRKVST